MPAPSPIDGPSPYRELAPEVPDYDHEDELPEAESPLAIGHEDQDGTIHMSIEDDVDGLEGHEGGDMRPP